MPQSPNLSPVSYEVWLKLIFDQRVSRARGHRFRYDYRVTNEARVVANMTRCCREFGALTKRFSPRQIDRGIWFLLGCDFELGAYLADPNLNLESRLDCSRAMLHPYSNFVARSRVRAMETCFDMWWDMLCGSFWRTHLQRLKRDELDAAIERDDAEQEAEENDLESSPRARFYAQWNPEADINDQLTEFGLAWRDLETHHSKITISYDEIEPDEQRVADAMLETLTQILYLEDQRCSYYALHGLNHLKHPRGAATVQAFVDRYQSEWTPEGLAWAKSCRDGQAM